jgi:hypothetical protein
MSIMETCTTLDRQMFKEIYTGPIFSAFLFKSNRQEVAGHVFLF